jgi:hypothetical protein
MNAPSRRRTSCVERLAYLACAVTAATAALGLIGDDQGFPLWLRIAVWVLAPLAVVGFIADAFDYESSLRFKWYDLWVGAYVDHASRTLYVCPLPCLLWTFEPKGGER